MNEAAGKNVPDGRQFRTIVLIVFLILVCGCGGTVIAVIAPLGEMVSLGRTDYQRQCDIALGTTTGTAIPTAPTTTTSAPDSYPAATSPRPTANPYAAMQIEDGDTDLTDRDRACYTAMQSAPYQDQPLRQPNTGFSAVCAADLALRYPEAGGTAAMAEYIRDVVYSASIVTTTGQCAPTRAPAPVAEESCGDPTKKVPAVVLPVSVGTQGYCGQLVDPDAASPGDVVFWEYRDNAATKAGIALGPRELVTVDNGRFVRLGVPDGAEVQIKRVLGEAA
ncbi:hypothetical protein [Nocardia grenadensis]|uniref:hypothetical protein n=1 Tax=Nocardia grenadensis TaxID=931537 RepID=UPI003D8E037E